MVHLIPPCFAVYFVHLSELHLFFFFSLQQGLLTGILNAQPTPPWPAGAGVVAVAVAS